MRYLFLGLWFIWTATMALGQSQAASETSLPVTLIADQMVIEAGERLIASGNVEILYGETKLRANGVTYDQKADQLDIIGPISIIEGDSTVILAEDAQLNPDLQSGLLNGARIVFDQQMQVAANRIQIVDERYTQMYKATASSCQVCGKNGVPLWSIRARRVVHDKEERQLYFDDASFRVLDVPVFYLPRLRLPDPTLKRARGFLMPSYTSTSQLGFGLKLPYFIPIGDSKDITVTPYISAETKTLELRYRQAFRNGRIEINGAVSKDTLLPENNDTRGYLFADGTFSIGRGYQLDFDIETTSDRTYLRDYDYAGKDRLDSEISVNRTRKDEYINAQLSYYETLRAGESNRTLPPFVGAAEYEKRYELSQGRGVVDVTGQVQSLYRDNDTDGDEGRDVSRASLGVHWNRSTLFGPGMLARFDAALYADHFSINQDSTFDNQVSRVTPYLASELRWPVAMTTAKGVRHVIEPVAQLVWSQDSYDAAPNESGPQAQFNEGNLFALSRFDGQDARELGARATFGLGYTRYDPDGWSMGATIGRSYRNEDFGQFNASSGLTGTQSDWITAVHLKLYDRLTLINRAVFDDSFNFARSETRVTYRQDKFSISSGYIWLTAGEAVGREDDISEWTGNASYKLTNNWTSTASWRYDSEIGRTQNAGLGLNYQNECVEMGVSASRRFTSSASVDPVTKFGFTLALKGFSTGGAAGNYAHSCK